MRIIADLHLHSKYSRATSKNMDLENIDKYAKIKGLNLIGTSDFTHPVWIKYLKEKLIPNGEGLFNLKNEKNISFMLTSEISLMYSQDGKGRRIHVVLFAPDFEVVDQITEYLKSKGRVDYDGRPIFSIPAPELTESLMKISKDIMVIPAHIWTPYFSLFGSMSGFDTVKDCFKDQTKNIFALETGMSSDPAMNWRLSQLDDFALVSNSDSHSYYPWRLGREANVFDIKPTYAELVDAIKKKDPKRFLFTVEVNPRYGKYHWDGHRACEVVMSPKEAIKHKNICPVCRRTLTIGVEHRVEELADRPEGFVPKNAVPFKSLLPLSELIAGLYNTEPFTKKVFEIHSKLMKAFVNEFSILLDVPESKLRTVADEKIVEAIMKNRDGKIEVQPGYDGVYGKAVFEKNEAGAKPKKKQKWLNDFV